MSDQQEEGNQDLESDEVTLEEQDERQEALFREIAATVLLRADELAEWTDILNRYINYLLLFQHPHHFQLINANTIVETTRQVVAATAIALITGIESAPGGEIIPRPTLPTTPEGPRLDTHLARIIGQATSPPPEWVNPRYEYPIHQDPDPNPAEDSDSSDSEDPTQDQA